MNTIALAVLCAAVLPCAGSAPSQDEDVKRRTPEEWAAVAARVQEQAQPGEQHERLASLEGVWDTELRYFAIGREEPSAVGSFVTRNELRIGGRFLESHTEGSLMGRTMESLNVYGFDRRTELFTAVVFDNAGTFYVTARGPWVEDERAARMGGEAPDPTMGVTYEFEFVLTFVDEDTYVLEIVFLDESHGNDGPYTMFEYVHRRRK